VSDPDLVACLPFTSRSLSKRHNFMLFLICKFAWGANMRANRWVFLCGISVVVSCLTFTVQPTQAQQIKEILEDLTRPAPPPPPPPGREEYRERMPPAPYSGRRDEHWERVREQMFRLKEGCEDGDRRSCVRYGILIGQNQERRANWQREHPELFWYER
jgi:hypothetical protein